MSVNELIEEALDLPVDERRLLADVIEASLPAPDPEIEKMWIEVATERAKRYEAGRLETIDITDRISK